MEVCGFGDEGWVGLGEGGGAKRRGSVRRRGRGSTQRAGLRFLRHLGVRGVIRAVGSDMGVGDIGDME